jgi:hypothetical protein
MLRRVALVRTDVLEEFLTRATQCNIPEDTILHSQRCENLKSYMNRFCHRITVCFICQNVVHTSRMSGGDDNIAAELGTAELSVSVRARPQAGQLENWSTVSGTAKGISPLLNVEAGSRAT